MTAKAVEFLSPVGRLVSGGPFDVQTKDAEGNTQVYKSGPNLGKPRVSYYVGLAIPKIDAGYAELWAKIYGVSRESFPSMFGADGTCTNPAFAFKITDGDSQIPNSKGKKPCDREGYKDHWVLHLSAGFAPSCFTAGGHAVITDPEAIKRGYYIRVYGSIVGNGSPLQPGVFLNLSKVELVGFGEEIFTGISGEEAFGGTAAVLPAGASATPLAPSTTIAPPIPAAAAQAQVPVIPATVALPQTQAPGAGPTAPPVITPPAAPPIAPANDFLDPNKTYNINGTSYTYDQLKAANYTDELIKTLM